LRERAGLKRRLYTSRTTAESGMMQPPIIAGRGGVLKCQMSWVRALRARWSLTRIKSTYLSPTGL
jgi:hypothetical protein